MSGEIISGVPTWITAVPTWGLLGGLIYAVVKHGPEWKSQSFSEAESMCKALQAQVDNLRDRLNACEDECRGQAAAHKTEVNALHNELMGERRQRVQEQLSMINAIMSSVDSPQLKSLLGTLESVQRALKAGDEFG